MSDITIQSKQDLIKHRERVWKKYCKDEITVGEYLEQIGSLPKEIDVMSLDEYRDHIFNKHP